MSVKKWCVTFQSSAFWAVLFCRDSTPRIQFVNEEIMPILQNILEILNPLLLLLHTFQVEVIEVQKKRREMILIEDLLVSCCRITSRFIYPQFPPHSP